MQITKCRDFSREHDYDAFSVVRVFNGCLEPLGGRGAWVTISGGKVALYRRAQGAGGTGLTKDGIELDYDSRLELGINGRPDQDGFYSCELVLAPSSYREKIRAHWTHPSLAYRAPYQLAVLSVVLGGVGLLLGVSGLVIGIISLK